MELEVKEVSVYDCIITKEKRTTIAVVMRSLIER